MSKIKITCDSTCDLTAELYEKYDVEVIPLEINLGGTYYKDSIDITSEQIYAYVGETGVLPKTAAISMAKYEETFKKYTDEGYTVIHINISSAFSACYQNACLAAEDFSNVRVIDSQNLSTGQGLVVLKACELARNAADLDTLADQVRAFTEKVEASFVVDKLDYLVKGGRCSSAAALGANLLNLKPCIEVKNGKMSVGKKYRGNYAKCLSNYIKERLEGRDNIDTEMMFLTHTVVSDDVAAAAANAVNEYGHFETVYDATAGCTVSCHCGPGTLGIIFVRK